MMLLYFILFLYALRAYDQFEEQMTDWWKNFKVEPKK